MFLKSLNFAYFLGNVLKVIISVGWVSAHLKSLQFLGLFELKLLLSFHSHQKLLPWIWLIHSLMSVGKEKRFRRWLIFDRRNVKVLNFPPFIVDVHDSLRFLSSKNETFISEYKILIKSPFLRLQDNRLSLCLHILQFVLSVIHQKHTKNELSTFV